MLPKHSKMPAIKDSHIVKIAVEYVDNTPQMYPQLIEFDQRQPLGAIIQNLCSSWGIPDAESYALQFDGINYVTEKNRNEVKNGTVLKLRFSPSKTTNDILEKLRSGTEDEKVAELKELQVLSADNTFALEFIKEQGLRLIIALIEDGQCEERILELALCSFVQLMEHGTISWDILEPSFIMRNVAFINGSSKPEIIQSALSILENIVQSSNKYALVEKEITLETLLKLLRDATRTQVQQNAIALLNALFIKADDGKRRMLAATLGSKQYRSVINSVITPTMGAEMAHQLYVLQTLTLGLLEQRMKTAMDVQDQDAQEKIKELRRIAFEADGIEPMPDVTARRQHGSSYSSHYKKLGFKCDINPAQDFFETPPGTLALDCMIYFARNYTQSYTKVVHENSCRADEHECPFGRTSIELVKVLCDIFRIGESPSEQGQEFYPMFFTHDHPFEEFFCICIVVLNKTWKDMRATTEDFVKVFSVVREQIVRSIVGRPASLEDFKAKIHTFTYNTITTLRQQERTSREECESTASAIVSLKKKITPEIRALIKEQRLGYLIVGTRFCKYSGGKRERDKYWYVRLSPNHKVIHYGDCDEKTVPTLEELSNKLPVIDIRQMLVGKECPHMKEMRSKKASTPLGFSLVPESSEQPTLDFIAPDEATFNYWTDGINALLGQPMTSKQQEEDFETLLSMEIKLRLLDTEGVDISKDPPAIPPEPENYDFCFDS
ncbi:engulfment and cell motility protein 1 [Anopheles merus]|uniref:AGAP009236-PA n=6 Tax=gambiae species complex TaxID=44542 RepID=Q7PVN1_ANOGA|nr:engulfment and cell motility protein 1 [Anopheles merus]XP_041778260.1 engulfment and cell motility protein 1 [Anopheles merus]XP_061518951.1 engulfment and cell motility protein 1 [Anopheles gambiae]XP_061518952.1 engulfment and cell motility protein 1 [Anopheles gambiae]EAA15037.3 AGAP009236-PA [Anopheles gambiae str. PEST]